MLIKRLRWILYAAAFIVALSFLWSNILIFDDFHPAHEEIFETGIDPQQVSTEIQQENKENQPQKQPAKKGYHIHINLDEVTMYVYKNDELLKTYPVSGGKPSTPTPLGTWRIISKDTWGEGFGGAWMGFNVPWGKYGIHGTVYPWFIGKSNSSKGCIRMLNKDVKELYKLVPHGTTVTIVHSNRVFRTLKSGDIGSDVKEVQSALKKLGYYHGSSDGKFGSGLAAAVKKFQKDNKLWGAGAVNKKTYNLILEKLKLKESE